MPLSFQCHRLANGLTIVAEVDPAAHSAACGFFVKTGARDESSEVMGVSHFLEHMMFKGTPDLTTDALNRAFDEIGARNNAFTSNELTCFYAHVLPEHLGRAAELLGRMMRPALRQADFDTEKGVILEEIAMYQDNPFWVLYESAVERHFGAHPLSHRVLGTAETIGALTRDQMAAYFERRYSADNTVAAFSGRLDFDAVCRGVESVCGSWGATRVGRDSTRPVPPGGAFTRRDAKVTRAYQVWIAEAPAFEDERRYAAAMLSQVLGASDNSRLHWSLVEPGLAEEAQVHYEANDGTGQYLIYVSGEPSRMDEIAQVIDRERAGLIGSITPDDLARLVNKTMTGAALGGERPLDRMQRLGKLWTYLGRYIPLGAEVERIARVTFEELRATHDAFPITPITSARLMPA